MVIYRDVEIPGPTVYRQCPAPQLAAVPKDPTPNQSVVDQVRRIVNQRNAAMTNQQILAGAIAACNADTD
ncbi:MAG: hypothetical protein AAF607_15845 [Pseudomonadota bacterium]